MTSHNPPPPPTAGAPLSLSPCHVCLAAGLQGIGGKFGVKTIISAHITEFFFWKSIYYLMVMIKPGEESSARDWPHGAPATNIIIISHVCFVSEILSLVSFNGASFFPN